ncbi:MAG: alanine--tRNA ligase [Weeping tea tree witches'-broom phytoplasma]|uniref:alanine--tRNA ligase n=1 Tax=Candidatus Phytoplasma melaleucae TaxID=2982630 RepID=UPI00293A0F0E|nr:alanine--tRNA ligase [Weeping tea tree witches'-broom phytoplasma]
MQKITSWKIRKMWLNFFSQKNHHIVPSAPLIPDNDPTLLWVNAGIAPLKKYFNGSEPIHFRKIVNIQKCLRTSDIENVGKTSRHHTFFEMLGNFSIGDYFKKEAISLAYEFLTSKNFLALPRKKLYITYFDQDTETRDFWLKEGIHPSHLISLNNNFWKIGEGPCGPCTEIFFDRGFEYDIRDQKLITQNIENNRFIEIWNIVFSQYYCANETSLLNYRELPQKNIDTGAGLERLACILQNKQTNFETDLFFPIIQKIENLSEKYYTGNEVFKIIADHIKTLVFGIGDGVILSNTGRGYILKKILRRAFLKGEILGFKKPFLFQLVPTVGNMMSDFYPYLKTKINIIQQIIQKEEEKFLFNLQEGETKFLEMIKHQPQLSSTNFFKLYDTYGVPKEVILDYAKKNQISVETSQFESLLKKQKEASYINKKRKNLKVPIKQDFLDFKALSEFIGYKCLETQTKVIAVFDQGIVLEKTPFYAEMGGQISDEGTINNLPVTKVIKLPHGQFLHCIVNKFTKNQKVTASVNKVKRYQTSLNHTATHLLHEALRVVLTDSIQQQGSKLNDRELKFDFNYYQNLSLSELIKIEHQVNSWIKQQLPVTVNSMSFAEAQKIKAQVLENTNYSDTVRVVTIQGISTQLCGGTHATNTFDLKQFAILSYDSIGSGVYRIEATTENNVTTAIKKRIESLLTRGNQMIKNIDQNKKDECNQIISSIKADKNSYQDINDVRERLNELEKKLTNIRKKNTKEKIQHIIQKAHKFIPAKTDSQMLIAINDDNIETNMLKLLLEYLFNKLKTDFLCIYQQRNDHFIFLCKSNNSHAGNFVKRLNKMIDGKGGGNQHFGQGISTNLDKIDVLKQKWMYILYE